MKISNNRIEWIDYAKAVAIVLVIVGHAIPEYNLNLLDLQIVINLIHMPLFFILSGYVFKIKENESFKFFVQKKIKSLLLPYIIFCFLIFICHILQVIVLHSNYDFFEKLFTFNGIINVLLMTTKSSFSNLWFLPCIFVAEIILFIALRYIENKKKCCLVCIILGGVSFIFNRIFNIMLPLSIETALVAVIYMYVGVLLRNRKVMEKSNNIFLFICIGIFIICSYIYIYYLRAESPSFYNLEISYPVVFLISSITSSLAIMKLCMKMKNQTLIQYIGMNTLYIYGLHFIVQNIIGIFLKFIPFLLNYKYILLLSVSALNVSICLVIIKLYDKVNIRIRRKNEDINCKNVS